MKEDKEKIASMLKETVKLLCCNGLDFQKSLKIQGLLGITIDESDVFIIQIDDFSKSQTNNYVQAVMLKDSDNDKESISLSSRTVADSAISSKISDAPQIIPSLPSVEVFDSDTKETMMLCTGYVTKQDISSLTSASNNVKNISTSHISETKFTSSKTSHNSTNVNQFSDGNDVKGGWIENYTVVTNNYNLSNGTSEVLDSTLGNSRTLSKSSKSNAPSVISNGIAVCEIVESDVKQEKEDIWIVEDEDGAAAQVFKGHVEVGYTDTNILQTTGHTSVRSGPPVRSDQSVRSSASERSAASERRALYQTTPGYPNVSHDRPSNRKTFAQFQKRRTFAPQYPPHRPSQSLYQSFPRRPVHSSAKQFVCEFPGCGLAYYERKNLLAHQSLKHGRSRGVRQSLQGEWVNVSQEFVECDFSSSLSLNETQQY